MNYALIVYRIWESYGVQVTVNTSDISTKAGCEQLIRDSMKLGPVGGIFNLAVILKDSIFDNQDVEKFVECMAPKAVATKHLDELTRQLCPELQYFVVFSSVSCGRGNAGQSNYGMANSVMERIIEQRHLAGLPAKAIQWGAVGEVGLVADMQEDKHDMEIGGTLQQRISSCLEVLDPLLAINEPVVSSMVVAEKRFNATHTGNVLEAVMNIMGIRDMKSFSMEATLSELGMDSLMTVEIQQTLEREHDLVISAQDLRSFSLSKLVESADSKKTKEDDVKSEMVGVGMLLRNLGDEANDGQLILQIAEHRPLPKITNLIIPGIEGSAGDIWKELANSLRGNSSVIQHKNISDASTISDSINQIANEVLRVYEKSDSFYIVGYSFGSLLSLKLASILESKGKKGKLLLIDGSPQFLKKLLTEQVGSKNFDEIIEVIVLNAVTDLVIPNKGHEVLDCIHSRLNLNDKVDRLLKMSENFKIYSPEYMKKMVNVLINNARLLFNLDVNDFKPLTNTQVHLVRPQDSVLKDVDRDYGLGDISNQKLEITFVQGNHMTMLESLELKKILHEFNS